MKSIEVKDVMYTPADGEYVPEDATLDEGIHQLVIGHRQSLLVTRDSKVVGVLRLSDVFSQICKIIESLDLGSQHASRDGPRGGSNPGG